MKIEVRKPTENERKEEFKRIFNVNDDDADSVFYLEKGSVSGIILSEEKFCNNIK